MTIEKLNAFLADTKEDDQWWVAVDGLVRDNIYTLKEIERDLKDKSKVAVLHTSKANSSNPIWLPVDWQEQPANEESDEVLMQTMSSGYSRQIKELNEQVAELKAQMAEVLKFVKELHFVTKGKEKVQKMIAEVERRETYVEQSEAALLKRISKLEEREAILRQAQEDHAEDQEKAARVPAKPAGPAAVADGSDGEDKEKLVKFG